MFQPVAKLGGRAEKLRETKVWVPTPGRLRPARGWARSECGRVVHGKHEGISYCIHIHTVQLQPAIIMDRDYRLDDYRQSTTFNSRNHSRYSTQC